MSTPISGPLFDYEARIISLLGRIESPQIDLVIDQLLRLDADSEKEITLFLSGQGSNITEALKLSDSVGLLRSRLTVVGLGLIEGAAVMLLATASQRILLKSALVSTAGLWELPGLHPCFKAGIGLHAQAGADNKLRDHIRVAMQRTLGRYGHQIESILLDAEDKPRILNAEECLSLGLADSIVEGPHRLLHSKPLNKYTHVRLSH